MNLGRRARSRPTLPWPIAWFLAGASAAFLWGFIELTERVFGSREGGADVHGVDAAILTAVAGVRRGWFTGIAVDLTALGSATVLTLCTATTLMLLASVRGTYGSIQRSAGAAGASAWVGLLKPLLERDRPQIIPRLIDVSGFSHPSGHSLPAAAIYATLAVLAFRIVEPGWYGPALLSLALTLIVSVGFSRVYLGVHDPTDVLAGPLAGCAWARLVTAVRLWLAPGEGQQAPARIGEDHQ